MRDAIRGPAPQQATARKRPVDAADPGITELHRVAPRRTDFVGSRLNLLLPTLEPNRVFGGARTALDLFEGLAPSFAGRRIVAFTPVSDAAMASLDGYRLVGPDDPEVGGADGLVVAAPRGSETSLAVGAGDVFLATFWTTAELAIRLVRWQESAFGPGGRRLAYLVQDWEPGFYPWSAQSEMARSTYASDIPTLAVINTAQLRDFIAGEGIRFAREFAFEPQLSGGLRTFLHEPPIERARRVVVYGRPETPRNAFPLIVDGLRAWRAADPRAAGWEVVSVGRPHLPVSLGGDARLTSLGKLDLAGYGRLLRESAVGLSLMVSPHPSYPPLEMAHLGMLVATNRFASKELATWHENITSLDSFTPDGVARALSALTARFDADPSAGDRGRPLRPDFLSSEAPFPFLAELAAELLAGSTSRAPD